ncbi:MAG: hypothetical protein IT389_02895 [Nitrospira sp.]|nr:hypothetical protein [Nitrospira sp.]
MTFGQRLKSTAVDESRIGVLFEMGIRALFYMICANVFILFFVQGGYDIELGPLHIHAYSLRNWLLVCLAFALASTWLEGRRAGVSAFEWVQSPLLLFIGAMSLYYLNGHTFETADTLPARLLPASLLVTHDFYLDEYASTIDVYKDQYFVRSFNGHLVPTYPPWGAVLAVPVYLIPVLKNATRISHAALFDLEKRAAVLITALAVLMVLLTLRRMARPAIAWFIAVVYAFGTSCLSISSQALWQHGPSQLFFSLTLYCVVRGRESPSWIAWAGLPLGYAVICRPLNVVMALPIALYVLHKHRAQFFGFIAAGVPSLLLFMSYNAAYFGSPLRTGFGATVVTPASLVGQHLSWLNTPVLEGVAGVLFSPSRGLFVYSPILLCSIAGMVLVWKKPGQVLLRYLSLSPILLLIPVSTLGHWWGGHGYGPRLLADSVPILCLLLYPVVERIQQSAPLKRLLIGLAAFSIGMHGIGFATDFSGDRELIDFDAYPERVWSWRESPPVLFGAQLCAQMGQALSSLIWSGN